MSRYARGHKVESKRRIVDAAAALFRRDGIDAVGVASIMEAADMTHGGFYAHFPSKEALVRAGLDAGAEASTAAHRAAAAQAPAGQGLACIVARYMSRRHRDGPASGCVLASLTPEVARRPAATRATFTGRVRAMLSLLREYAEVPQRDEAAMQVLATLVGSLQLARAVDDPELSEAFLRAGKRAAVRLGGAR